MFISDRILALLAERPSMSGLAIRAALPDCKRVAISVALARLEDRGMIEAAGWGTYRLAAGATISRAASAKW